MDKINIELMKIRYYLLPFLFFTFFLIVYSNFFLFLFVLSIFILIYGFLVYKYKNLSFLTILFFIASISLSSYNFFMKSYYLTYQLYGKTFIKWNVDVLDILGQWKYLVKTDKWWTFIARNMTKWFKIWDIIKIYGMLYPNKLKYTSYKDFSKNFFSLRFNLKRNIFKFDYSKYLVMKWIVWIIYSKKEFKTWYTPPYFYKRYKQELSDKIVDIYKNYDDKYKALVLWLLIWDKSLLSKKLYDQFIHSWLVHIIVVSGWNIMFLIIFLSIILFFIPFYIRLIFIWLGVIIYSLLVGWDSSVIRATIMWILSLLALFFWRVSDVRRLLAIAFIIMVIYNPYFLWYDLWFILSFLAILWILFFEWFSINIDKDEIYRQIRHMKDKKTALKLKTKQKIKDGIIYFYNNYILPTLGASLFVAPAIVVFTWNVNLLSFISSILVVPLVPILMLLNILILFLSMLSTYFTNMLVLASVHIMKWVFFVNYLFGEKIIFKAKLEITLSLFIFIMILLLIFRYRMKNKEESKENILNF